MRTFIALELPPATKDSLGRLITRLQTCGADVKWTKPENIHVTLKFLGDTNEKKLDAIKDCLEEIAKGNAQFSVSLSSLGAFPNMRSPRVVWVGMGQGDDQTKSLARDLEEKIAKIGLPKEDRPFSSHITLGRTRSALNLEKLIEALEKNTKFLEGEKIEFQAGKIVFFKSTLTPLGPIYEALKEADLATT